MLTSVYPIQTSNAPYKGMVQQGGVIKPIPAFRRTMCAQLTSVGIMIGTLQRVPESGMHRSADNPTFHDLSCKTFSCIA